MKNEFKPNYKVTVMKDENHIVLLYAKYGGWQYSNVLYQLLLAESATYSTIDRINYIKSMAIEIQQSKWLQNVIDLLIKNEFKFYIELCDNKTGWIQIGIRNNQNSINWFNCMTFEDTSSCQLAFNHSYNQGSGKIIKSFRYGEKVKESIEKKIGIKFRDILKDKVN